jgi:hypothetical protein
MVISRKDAKEKKAQKLEIKIMIICSFTVFAEIEKKTQNKSIKKIRPVIN